MLRDMPLTKHIRSQNGLKEAEVPLYNNHNYDYIGKFYYGSPPQMLRACFDTGSANGWLLSSDCTSNRCHTGTANKYFTPALSTTF